MSNASSGMPHDGVMHHPLGAASYYFQKALIPYISAQCPKPIIVHVGAQPNSIPHLGNVTTFATAFAVAAALIKIGRDVKVVFVYVDTAPAKNETIENVCYQRALGDTDAFAQNKQSFEKVLNALAECSGVDYEVETQDMWRRTKGWQEVMEEIIERRQELGAVMSPERGLLGLRRACPECKLADKHGVKTRYENKCVVFYCAKHGEHRWEIDGESKGVGLSTPVRNLMRLKLCERDEERSWVMVTGGDYAGFYQEQMMWRVLRKPGVAVPKGGPIILYAPLVVDWGGGKLSKTLYVKEGAYGYLREQDMGYVMDSDELDRLGGVQALYAEVEEWMKEPYRLFRNYSVEYLHRQLISGGMKWGNKQAEQE